MVQRTCELCKKDIGPEEAFMKMPDEKAAHEKCFSLGSCPVCAKDLRVVEDLVGANGKKYHVDCFKCSKCQQKLQSYVVRDDNLFCKPCVMAEQEKMAAKSKGTCVACSKDVLSNQKAFSMDEGMYHADCFVCAQCKGDLTQGCTILEDKLCCRSCMNNMKEKLLEEKRNQLQEQQARSSQQKNATQSITCAECNQPITTQALQALGRAWHVGCIKCFQCKNPMSGKLFPIDNEPYCGDCAEKRKQESIQRQTQEQNRKQEEHQQDEAKRRAAHEAAEKEREELTKSLQEKAKIQSQSPGVQCSVCGTHIHGAYQELGGIIHCNDCAEMVQKAIVCDKCKKTIAPGVQFRRTQGKFFHLDCFCCVECKSPVKGNNYKEHNGDIFCEEHFAKLLRRFKENCPTCNNPVTDGEVVIEKNSAYHAQCFTCTTCKKPFPNGQYSPSNGGFYCRECFIGAQLAEANKGGIIKINDDE